MHAGTVGIENPGNLNFETMLAVIVEKQGLGATFSLVIAGAWSDRIDVAPVIFSLRMNRGIAINFAGRRLKNATLKAFGEAEHVDGAVHRSLCRLHRIM